MQVRFLSAPLLGRLVEVKHRKSANIFVLHGDSSRILDDGSCLENSRGESPLGFETLNLRAVGRRYSFNSQTACCGFESRRVLGSVVQVVEQPSIITNITHIPTHILVPGRLEIVYRYLEAVV